MAKVIAMTEHTAYEIAMYNSSDAIKGWLAGEEASGDPVMVRKLAAALQLQVWWRKSYGLS